MQEFMRDKIPIKRCWILFAIFFMFFISGCAQKENMPEKESQADEKITEQATDNIAKSVMQQRGLGTLCSTEEKCINFCFTNRGRCESYCKGNHENELCQQLYPAIVPPQDIDTPPEQSQQPVLKNLGVNIEPWNKQTNLAGDLMFDKKVIYDDGGVANEKVFIDFGSKDKYRIDDIGVIEYWFFVPLGTKVRAPIGGTVQIGFFEHTQDWGISFYPEEGSKWIVSFEHVVNLNVKEGDIVKAGDIVAEAAPRINKEIAMVELAVWRPSRDHIYKYCPFEFLDESLKPMYEEKINQLAKDWEEFIGKDVYKQEDWVAPGCLLYNITER